MGKPKTIQESFGNFGIESYEGQSIEDRCKKLVETREPIKDTSPLIYTPKEKGVMPCIVRADKWEIAQDAMDRDMQRELQQKQMEYGRKMYAVQIGKRIIARRVMSAAQIPLM